MESNEPNIHVYSQGLIDNDIKGFEMESDYSWITFGRNVSNPRIFTLYMIGTTEKRQGEGHATQLLDYFFAFYFLKFRIIFFNFFLL